MRHIQHLYLAPQAALHARLLASGSTTPTTSGVIPSGKAGLPSLPGLHVLVGLIGDATKLGFVVALAGLVISIIRLGIGHHAGNPGEVTKAKHGMLASLLAAVLLGGSTLLIDFAGSAGKLI